MTNLKVVALVVGLIVLYTMIANMIPQVQSEVPQELSFGADVTAEQLIAAGDQLYQGAGGCTACHGLGVRAPNLLTDEGGTGTIGVRCADRVPGEDCKTYLHESLINPSAYVVAGYQPIMTDMRRTLSGQQIWSLVAYLQNLGGDVTVTGEDIAAAEPAGGAAGGALAGGSVDPNELLNAAGCMVCHKLGDQGAPIGPAFDGMGARRSAESIRRKILDPRSDTTAGFEALAGVMPATFGQQFNAAQLEAIVQFLANRR